jgi:hypothetical protein
MPDQLAEAARRKEAKRKKGNGDVTMALRIVGAPALVMVDPE